MTHQNASQQHAKAPQSQLPEWDLSHLYPSPTSAAYAMDMRLTCQVWQKQPLFLVKLLPFQKLLNKTSDTIRRRTLLTAKVEDALNTVVRQVAFFSFENCFVCNTKTYYSKFTF